MNLSTRPPHGNLVAATPADHSRLSRQVRSGQALRLASGLYAVGATLAPEQVARHHLQAVIAHIWPGAVLCGRTALAGGVAVNGEVYIAHPDPPRRTELALPGVTVVPFVGPPALSGDMGLPLGLSLSGQARQLVENVSLRGRQPRFRAGTSAVDNRIDELARSGGAGQSAKHSANSMSSQVRSTPSRSTSCDNAWPLYSVRSPPLGSDGATGSPRDLLGLHSTATGSTCSRAS